MKKKVREGIARPQEKRKTGCEGQFGWERDKREENNEEKFSL